MTKKNLPEAARTGEAISLAFGLTFVFAVMLFVVTTTIAASGMPLFETGEVHIEQIPH